MSYFPAFLEFKNKKVLIVGGGAVAYEKLKHLLDFTQNITLIAEDYSQEILQVIIREKLPFYKRSYKNGDLQGYNIVVVAIDNTALQAAIFQESKKHHCLCNSVDSTKYCDFIFPAYIKKGELTIAISTSGTSPAIAKYLRIYLQTIIPQSIVEFLQEMKKIRKTLPKGKKRMKMLDTKAKRYIESWKQ